MQERVVHNLQNEEGLKPQQSIKDSPVYAQIVAFRHILEKLVNKEEYENLKKLLAYQDINNISPEEVSERLNKMINHEILLEYDKWFGIKAQRGGTI